MLPLHPSHLHEITSFVLFEKVVCPWGTRSAYLRLKERRRGAGDRVLQVGGGQGGLNVLDAVVDHVGRTGDAARGLEGPGGEARRLEDIRAKSGNMYLLVLRPKMQANRMKKLMYDFLPS